MSSKTTKVKAIRIKNETAEYFSDKPLNRVVESVHSLAVEEKIEIKGDGQVVIPGSDVKWQSGRVRS